MGEVYRANDLTLDQPVALKFLPAAMASNGAMLARFHAEVRIARQVSHPNVCRVYDIGEVEGQLFLTMEYVDGEDLAGLLRRIGRLPADKGIEIARKLCAGLAAAHDKGVLHRDLKPANIMLDSHGRPVIMDFGLAGVADQIVGAEILAGTPGYMAPEQLSGREVSVRSDIYALGLVMYEMFTGKRPFEGNSLAEMVRLQQQTLPASLTEVIKDLDPAVERVILRCLAADPRSRPASALSVAAALPGGDPLAAALAAGETPSPDLVAASGATEGMRPAYAIACAAWTVLALIAMTILSPMVTVSGLAPLELPPDALTQKAREIARSLGYTQKPTDFARGFEYELAYLKYLEKYGGKPAPWDRISIGQPSPVFFWYRQSPRYLEAWSHQSVTLADPPELVSGMLSVILDSKGRLVNLRAVPDQIDDASQASQNFEWKRLFEAAGLDMATFEPDQPAWTPPFIADQRAAWTGQWPDQPAVKLRVEAAAWHGRPVYFITREPWVRPSRMEAAQPSLGQRIVQFMLISLALAGLIAGGLLARYNIRHGRGDVRGATRLAAFTIVEYLLIWVVTGNHVPTSGEFIQFLVQLGRALVLGGGVWVVYVAIDPYVRRNWPQALISWNRILAGGLRDPLVGRDILAGVTLGCFWGIVWALSNYVERPFGVMPSYGAFLPTLFGARFTIGWALISIPNTLASMLLSFFLLFGARALLRREWLAGVAFVSVMTVMSSATSAAPQIDAPLSALVLITVYFILTRAGFVAYFVAVYVQTFLVGSPATSDFSTWYSGTWISALLLTASVAAYGLWATLSGRSSIKDELL